MQEKIIRQLKTLQLIEPDTGFVSRTRNLFTPATITKKTTNIESITSFNWNYAIAFVCLLVVAGTFSFFPFRPQETLASLDAEALSSEIRTLPINVQLKEIQYEDVAQETIKNAVVEAADTDTNHLNETIIEKEISANDITMVNKNVDDLLQKATQ